MYAAMPVRKQSTMKELYSMLEQQENMRIPTELIPHCLHCGKLTMNLRSDNKFVQDEG